MITVDNLLLKIVNNPSPTVEEILPKRDSRVLRSLATSVSGNFFITENQSRLLIKILRENSKKMPEFTEEIDQAITDANWSRRFRQIEQVRKMYIDKNSDHEPCLILEFTFNSQIRKILQNLTKNLENFEEKNPGKVYEAALTEKNIIALVDVLSSFDFEIDETVKNHYATIKSWSRQDFSDQFLITNITHPNFQKHILTDLGVETAIDKNIIKDRSMRYQYNIKDDEKPGDTLVEQVAYRNQPRVWIDKNTNSLEEIFVVLKQLRRVPVMVVFDNTSEEKNLKNLEILDSTLKNTGLNNDVGIYFRMPSSDIGKEFNKFISDNNYNSRLNSTTGVVVVQSGKIPKFFLNTPWKPMSVIVLDSNMGLRHGKTSVYTNCCDLIIEYADAPALRDRIIKWQ